MKKLLCVLLTITCVFTLVACGVDAQPAKPIQGETPLINGPINKNEEVKPQESESKPIDSTTTQTEPIVQENQDENSSETTLPIDDLKKDPNTFILNATVLEVQDNSILVEPAKDSPELNSADKIWVTVKNVKLPKNLDVGDMIRITYDGILLESYPAKITTVYEIVKYPSGYIGPIFSQPITPVLTYTNYVVRAGWIEPSQMPTGVQSAVSNHPVYKFTSNDELDTFKNQVNNRLSFTQFDSSLGDLDDEFFDTYSLVVAYVTASSGSVSYSVRDLVFGPDSATITLNMKAPEIGTCDMAGWFIIIIVPRETVMDCNNFYIDIENDSNFDKLLNGSF